jgi:hypothetical protein
MIVQSGNDACVALAEAIAGSEEAFAQLMNKEAARLGLKNTHFENATGLPHPSHLTTVRDLSVLATALIRDFPEFYSIYSIKEYTYNKIKQPNRNRLLFIDPTVDGVKTGHTDSAGYCLIASAKRNDRRLLSVVVGTTSDSVRAQESQKLLNWGYLAYDTVKVYSANQAVNEPRVWKGKENTVKAGFLNDFVLSVPKGDADKLKANVVSQQPCWRRSPRASRSAPCSCPWATSRSANTRWWPSTKCPRPAGSAACGTPCACGSRTCKEALMTEEGRTTLLEFPASSHQDHGRAGGRLRPDGARRGAAPRPRLRRRHDADAPLVEGQLPVDHLHRQRHLPGPARRAVRRAVVPPAGEGRPVIVRRPGRVPYEPTWRAMQDFTTQRDASTPDELWLVEHPPVYTLGQAGKAEHLLHVTDIPLVKIDRGGQITYHGPGQVVGYLLLDLHRRGLKVREMVNLLEQALIDCIADYGLDARRKDGAPGVYIDGAKVAALGLRVKTAAATTACRSTSIWT